MRQPLGAWVLMVGIALVSIAGASTLPRAWAPAQTAAQRVVLGGQVAYVFAGVAVVRGLWRGAGWCWIAAVVWGLASLVAAAGPLAYVPDFRRVARGVATSELAILVLALLLVWYARRIARPPGDRGVDTTPR